VRGSPSNYFLLKMTISVSRARAKTTDSTSIRLEMVLRMTPAIKNKAMAMIPRVSFLSLITKRRKSIIRTISAAVNRLI